MSHTSTPYRKDIDGLRAIAVLLVVLFHAKLGRLTGGFVGVDVFFVISGYLVGGQLVRELATAGGIDILQFYKRRCLRILPALVTLLGAVALFSFFIVAPLTLQRTGQSIVAGAASLANVYFGQNRGYFDARLQSEPLLHLWSLAVEEQFYLLLPPLLLLIQGAKVRPKLALYLLLATSLLWSIWISRTSSSQGYFGLPSRLWELVAGVLLAASAVKVPKNPRHARALQGLGLLLVLGSALVLRTSNGFPGWRAIPPVAGACLLLAWETSGFLNSVLRTTLFQLIGKASYSIYLIHWPLFVWAERYLFWLPSKGQVALRLGIVAFSIALGFASYRWIEQPFRTPAWRAKPSKITFGLATSSLALMMLLGLGLQSVAAFRRTTKGAVSNTSLYVGYGASSDWSQFTRRGDCFLTSGRGRNIRANCLPENRQGNAALLVGDSYAAQLWRELQNIYPEVTLGQANASGRWDKPRKTPRVAYAQAAIDHYLQANRPKFILICLNWKPGDSTLLRALVARYRASCPNIVIIGGPPEYRYEVPQMLEARALFGGLVPPLNAYLNPTPFEVEKEMALAARELGVKYFSLQRTLCRDTLPADCTVEDRDQTPLQIDKGHLSPAGAKIVARAFREQFPHLAGTVESGSANRLE